MPFIQNIVLPLLKGIAIGVLGSVVGAFKVLIPIITVVARVLGWIGTKAAPLRGIIEKIGIVIGVIFGPAILRAISLLGRLGGVFKVVALAAKLAGAPIRLLGAIFGGVIRIAGRLFGVLGRVAGIAGRAASALLRPFTGIVDDFLTFGKNVVTAIANGIKSAPGMILDAIKSLLPGGKIGKKLASVLGFQHGGTMRGGMAFVGEAGPELLHVSRGSARVYPLTTPGPTAIAAGAGGGGGGTVVVPVHLDGRVITEVVARRTADRRARR
jgi:phage-related protein